MIRLCRIPPSAVSMADIFLQCTLSILFFKLHLVGGGNSQGERAWLTHEQNNQIIMEKHYTYVVSSFNFLVTTQEQNNTENRSYFATNIFSSSMVLLLLSFDYKEDNDING